MKRWKLTLVSLGMAATLLFGGCSSRQETTVDETTAEESTLTSKERVEAAKKQVEGDESENPEAAVEAVTVKDLGLEDGIYTVEVTLSGGSGRAAIESPAIIEIKDGSATATIIWSSPYYDYMMVGDKKFPPVNEEGNSAFEIPIEAFDVELPVIGDTTAMSEPHEIEYTLRFDSASVKKTEE